MSSANFEEASGSFPPIADVSSGAKLPCMKRASIAAAMLLLSSNAMAVPWAMPKDDFGGAVPLNRSDWLTADDYPANAALWHQRGYVTVSFAIRADGRASDCKVLRPSGYPLLDEIPCRLLMKRARFSPAKDGNGAPVATRGSTSVAFWTAP
jgi:TonB family protein